MRNVSNSSHSIDKPGLFLLLLKLRLDDGAQLTTGPLYLINVHQWTQQ